MDRPNDGYIEFTTATIDARQMYTYSECTTFL